MNSLSLFAAYQILRRVAVRFELGPHAEMVYIRHQEDVENGQIAAVMVGDEEATLKRFYYDGKMLQLVPENSKYRPLVFMGADLNQVRVIGLAVAYTRIIH